MVLFLFKGLLGFMGLLGVYRKVFGRVYLSPSQANDTVRLELETGKAPCV